MSTTIKYLIFFAVVISALFFSLYFLYATLGVTDVAQHILMEVLAGFFVSFTFILLLLRFFRPKFLISPYICYRNGVYYFKIVNQSIYHAFDVSLEIYLVRPYSLAGAKVNADIGTLPMQTASITTINRFRRKASDKDPFSLFALIIPTKYGIEEKIIEQGVYLEFRLTAKHGLTGLSERFVQKFPNETMIKKDYKFEFGPSLNVMLNNHS